MKDLMQLIPPVLVAIVTLLLVAWANGREHSARVHDRTPYYWENRATSVDRGWWDETDPARRGGYPSQQR